MERNATGSRRPLFRRPVFVAGTDATLLGRPVISPEHAAGAGFHALDLDLRASWHCGTWTPSDPAPAPRIRTAWIPRHYSGIWRDARAEHLRRFLTRAVDEYGLRTVVVPSGRGSGQRGTSLGQLARQLTPLSEVRVAMRVGAETLLAQDGSHLDQVANLRRMAEEWDLDLALDLTAPDIEAWEAEATLMRLFPRLTLVRIRPLRDASGEPDISSAARVGLRTVTMLADQAYGGVISIAPEVSSISRLLPAGNPSLDAADATRDEILAAYSRTDDYDITARQGRKQFG